MRRITFLVLVMALCYSNNTEAQFLKKLTKKLEDKLDRTTKNLEDKADKQVDSGRESINAHVFPPGAAHTSNIFFLSSGDTSSLAN